MTPGLFRFFLAMVVLVHHSFPLRLGGWAVGMFFVLSGFWISRMWGTSYSRKPAPYQTFLISRWWRIAPLFVTVQAIAVGMDFAGFWVTDASALCDWRWWLSQLTVVGSTQFGRVLPPSWSLDVEMQFYLLAPAILAVASRLVVGRQSLVEENIALSPTPTPEQSMPGSRVDRLRVALVSFVVITMGLMAWSVSRLVQGATLETPRLDVFAWLFLIGVAVELLDWHPSRRVAVISVILLLIVVGLVFANPASRHLVWFRGSDASPDAGWGQSLFFISTTLAALPLAIHTVHQPSTKYDRWMGDLSFPLYLFHWFPREWYYANVDWSLGALRNAGLLMANFAMAFAGAVVLLHLVDRPIQRMRKDWVKTSGE